MMRDYVGVVEATQTSMLGFELAGTVTWLDVDEGEAVKEKTPLAKLDTSRLIARQQELMAAYNEAESTLKLAKSNYKRFDELREERVVSGQRYDEAERERDVAEAALRRIKAQLQSVEVDLRKSEIKAPFDGVISRRMVDKGSVVSASQSVLEIMESGNKEIRLGVSAGTAEKLEIGQPIELTCDRLSPGKKVMARVSRVLPMRDRRARTVDFILTVESNGEHLREGDLVTASVPSTIDRDGFWVPRTALTESSRGLWAAYVASPTEEETVYETTPKIVEILHIDGEQAFVSGALQDGDLVIQDGLHRLVPNQAVKLTEAVRASEEPASAAEEKKTLAVSN